MFQENNIVQLERTHEDHQDQMPTSNRYKETGTSPYISTVVSQLTASNLKAHSSSLLPFSLLIACFHLHITILPANPGALSH